MGFHIEFKTLDDVANDYSKKVLTTITEMEVATKAYNEIITSNALYGKAGQAIANDINNNTGAILSGLKDDYFMMAVSFSEAIKKLRSKTGEKVSDGILDEEDINKIVTNLDNFANYHRLMVADTRKIFDGIEDIIHLSIPSNDFDQVHSVITKELKKIITDVNEFDVGNSTNLPEELLTAINSKISKAAGMVNLDYSTPEVQSEMADAEFAKVVGKINSQVNKDIAEEKKKQAAAEKSRAAWAKHHPLQNMWNEDVVKPSDKLWGVLMSKAGALDGDASWLSDNLHGLIDSKTKMGNELLNEAAKLVNSVTVVESKDIRHMDDAVKGFRSDILEISEDGIFNFMKDQMQNSFRMSGLILKDMGAIGRLVGGGFTIAGDSIPLADFVVGYTNNKDGNNSDEYTFKKTSLQTASSIATKTATTAIISGFVERMGASLLAGETAGEATAETGNPYVIAGATILASGATFITGKNYDNSKENNKIFNKRWKSIDETWKKGTEAQEKYNTALSSQDNESKYDSEIARGASAYNEAVKKENGK